MRNKKWKVTLFLIAAVLITTSFLGGTLAKYISNLGTGSDHARVARWGITEKNSSLDMFETAYDMESGNAKNTVESKNGEKVIAPGTKGDVIIAPAISKAELDKTEVAFSISYGYGDFESSSAYAKYTGNWSVGNFAWWPLRFKVYSYDDSTQDYTKVEYDGMDTSGGTKEPKDGGLQAQDLNDIIASTGSSEVIYPNDTDQEKITKLKKMGLKIEWEWPFERPETGSSDAVDGWDTIVGSRAAELDSSDTNMPTFGLSLKYKAVQVD